MVQRIFFPFILASSLLFLSDFIMTDGLISSPSVEFTRVGSINILLASNEGVEFLAPDIRTENNWKPTLCKV